MLDSLPATQHTSPSPAHLISTVLQLHSTPCLVSLLPSSSGHPTPPRAQPSVLPALLITLPRGQSSNLALSSAFFGSPFCKPPFLLCPQPSPTRTHMSPLILYLYSAFRFTYLNTNSDSNSIQFRLGHPLQVFP